MSETDCLVLHLVDNYYNIFILFDGDVDRFFICGKKIIENHVRWVPFSFYSKTEKILIDFIKSIMEHTINIHLYNFNNLPASCQNISFPLLNSLKNDSCELLFVENDDMEIFDNYGYLKMLKNINNNFEE